MQLSYDELKTTQMLRLSYTNINIMVGRFWHAVVMRGQKKIVNLHIFIPTYKRR